MLIALEIVVFQERKRVRNLLKTKNALLRQERKSLEVDDNIAEGSFNRANSPQWNKTLKGNVSPIEHATRRAARSGLVGEVTVKYTIYVIN